MANSNSGDSVVDRVVRVIAAFPEGVTALQLSELAARAELPLTTAHRLVRQLAGHGLLELGTGGSVRLGLRLWELVNRNSPTLALRQAAMPFMEDIQQVLNQNVNLAVLDGWEALFVERLSRRGSVANRAQMAGRMPVHVSSAGLALMANQPRAVQAEYLDGFSDPAGTAARRRISAPSSARLPTRATPSWPASWTRTRGGLPCPCWTAGSAPWRPSASSFPFARDAPAGARSRPCRPRRAGIGRRLARPQARRTTAIPFSGIHVTPITPPGAHC